MVRQIEFNIPAVPVAQPRARAVSFGGSARVHEVTHIGKGDNRRQHPIAAFKATVRMSAQESYSGPPIEGAICLDLVFVMPRPKGMIWKTKPMPRVRHVKKPDRDNLDKGVMDALKGILWIDDSQVCDGRIEKWIASGDEAPHVELRLTRIEE